MSVLHNGLVEDKNGDGIAIADLLRHPTLGLVSHQPDNLYVPGGNIRVMTRDQRVHRVDPDKVEAKTVSRIERDEYWSNFKTTAEALTTAS